MMRKSVEMKNSSHQHESQKESLLTEKSFSRFERSLIKKNIELSQKTQEDGCIEIVPVDRYNIVYFMFYLLGCGSLLPWNFFIVANNYFKSKLQDDDKLLAKFQNYFSIASMGPSLLLTIANVFILHRTPRYARIIISLTMMTILFSFTTALVQMDSQSWSKQFFIITIVKIVGINVFGAVYQGALFGMNCMFPTKYRQAQMAGQGLSGFLAAGSSILSIIGHNDVKTSAFGYFSVATVFLIISLFAYVILERMDFVKYHTRSKKTCFCSCRCGDVCHLVKAIDYCDKNKLEKTENHVPRKVSYIKIFHQLLPMAVSVYSVFFVSLSVFPSTIARIQSVSKHKNEWTGKYFVPVTCFLLFNICDYAGKSLSSYQHQILSKGPALVTLSFCRIVFIPLFAFCNVQPRINQDLAFFNHDAYPIVFMIIFALSNGYLGSVAMMLAPGRVHEKDSELAGVIMVFCLVAGLASGAAFSFAIAPNL